MSNELLGGRLLRENAPSTVRLRHYSANWIEHHAPHMTNVPRVTSEQAVSATEEPTYFGPAESPLFGVLHLPVDNRIRGAVLMCGSLAKEGTDSVRFQRIVGETLAKHGFAVLRFDYLGTGDSAYRQGRADAVENWLSSVSHAVSYLERLGAQNITAIGFRAGGLLINKFLEDRPTNLRNVVYFDPVGAGRRYLREHTTLYRLAVGADATLPGVTPVIGARFDDSAASEFGALRMDPDRRPVEGTLCVLRPTDTDSRLTEFAGTAGVESITVEGLPEFAQSADVMVPMPLDAADAMIEWIDRKSSRRFTKATPTYLRSVAMPAEANGISVVEQIERIGPKGLFGIRAVPQLAVTPKGKAVLFFATANDTHHGPNREWVELSRQVAASGSQAMRWARAGLGADGPVSRDQWQAVYSTIDIADAVDVARHTAVDPRQLELVGICSGSWYAAHVARQVGAGHIVMVNQAMWSWRVFTTLPWQWNLRKSIRAVHVNDARKDWDVERVRKALINVMKPTRNRLMSQLRRSTPRWLKLALCRIGLVHAPEVIMKAISRGGTTITVVASPWDAEQLGARGGVSALKDLPRAELVQPSCGDHSGYHPAILSAIREVVLATRTPTQAALNHSASRCD